MLRLVRCFVWHVMYSLKHLTQLEQGAVQGNFGPYEHSILDPNGCKVLLDQRYQPLIVLLIHFIEILKFSRWYITLRTIQPWYFFCLLGGTLGYARNENRCSRWGMYNENLRDEFLLNRSRWVNSYGNEPHIATKKAWASIFGSPDIPSRWSRFREFSSFNCLAVEEHVYCHVSLHLLVRSKASGHYFVCNHWVRRRICNLRLHGCFARVSGWKPSISRNLITSVCVLSVMPTSIAFCMFFTFDFYNALTLRFSIQLPTSKISRSIKQFSKSSLPTCIVAAIASSYKPFV